MAKILFIGESWMKHVIHQKGFDTFTSTNYQIGSEYLFAVLAKKHVITHLPSHRIQYDFPKTLTELQEYDVVVISDVGSNTFLLSDHVFEAGQTEVNKLSLIKDYVLAGKSLLMIGGYYSFSGIDGKARFGMTSLAEVLPVTCLNYDDRIEVPEGVNPKSVFVDHPILQGIATTWPVFLGYNKTNLKTDATLLVKVNEDPLIAVGKYGLGKSLVFTSDCAPHWGTKSYLAWQSHDQLWYNMIDFLTE